VIDDAWQRQGLGTRMLTELALHAARHGVTRIHADVLADNHAMRRLAEKTGCELRASPSAPWVLALSARLRAESSPPSRPTPGTPLFARAGR
jgi:GNAT superfamily N-acetyltransferase